MQPSMPSVKLNFARDAIFQINIHIQLQKTQPQVYMQLTVQHCNMVQLLLD